MIKTAKVIACLYAGIVAANAMDERETPDGMQKNIISAEVPVNANIITVSDKEEQQYGAFFEYINDIDKQNQAPSTVATIKNDNGIDQEESKVKEVDNKIDSEKVVPNTDNGQNKENPKTKKNQKNRKKQNKLKSECKTDQPKEIDYSKYIEIEGKPASSFYIIQKLKINNEELEKVCAKKTGEPIVIEYNIFGKTKIGDNEYKQTFIASKSLSSVESNYLQLKLNFQQKDGTNVIFPKDCSELFADSTALREVNFSSAEFSKNGKATTARHMFYSCSKLQKIDFQNFDTGNITDMRGMFALCHNLTDLKINHFNTANVEDMRAMFSNCRKLESLDLKHFNTEKVKKMNAMFACCNALKNLTLSNFNTKNVTEMQLMFNDCFALKMLDLQNFNTENVIDMSSMFDGCKQIEILNLHNFVTNNLKDVSRMFKRCISLERLDLSNFKFNEIEKHKTEDYENPYYGMFGCCIGLSEWNKNKEVKAEQKLVDYIKSKSKSIDIFDCYWFKENVPSKYGKWLTPSIRKKFTIGI